MLKYYLFSINHCCNQYTNTLNWYNLGIKRGEILLHHLVEQWKKTSPNQSRYRETLICLMKVFQHSNSMFKINMLFNCIDNQSVFILNRIVFY